MARTLSEADAEPGEATHDVAGSPARLLDRLHRREPLEQCSERGLQLHPTERRTQAEVDPRPEGQVRVRGPSDVEAVGILEYVGITVRRAEDEAQLGATGDLDPVELERLEDPALEQLQRRVEAQQLLDGGRDQAVVVAEPRQL